MSHGSRHPVFKGMGRALGAGALLTALSAGAARADFPGDVPDRFKIQLGSMDSRYTTEAAFYRTGGPAGAFIDFEGTLDLPAYKKDWNVGGFYRFSDKGYLDFGYADLERTAQRVLDQDVQWGGYKFLVNAQVNTEFGTAFGYLAYRHDFLHLEQVHISASAGLSYMMLDSGLSADAGVLDQNGNSVTGSVNVQSDVSFPVPLLGLQLDWKLTRRTAIGMFLRTLYIDYHDFAGGIRQSAVRYEWYATRHFGIGGGLLDYKVDIGRYRSGNYTAQFHYDVTGLDLYLKLAF